MKLAYDVGSRIGRLVVVSHSGTRRTGLAIVKCDCGTTKQVRLRQWGRTKSCGCWPRGHPPGKPSAPMVGRVYGLLTVLESRVAVRDGAPQAWREVVVRCECGTVKTIRTSNIYNSTRSCGCIRGGVPSSSTVPQDHPLRSFWARHRRSDMVKEWQSLDAFVRDVGKRQDKMVLGKLRPGEPLGPTNFAWVPYGARMSQSAKAVRLEHDGVVRSISQWAASIGVSRQALGIRLRKMPLAEALALPRRPDAPISSKAKCRRCRKILDATVMDAPGGRVHRKCWSPS